jgi:hypothetical protein
MELSDYLALVPAENSTQPDFIAMLTAALTPLVEGQTNLWNFLNDFDLDQAIGVQLDQVGLWIGLSRNLVVSIPPYYFSFNISGLGFNQGYWYSPYDPTTEIVQMDDSTYRSALKAKARANVWDGTTAGLQAIVAFVNSEFGISLTLKDNLNMTMTLGYTGTVPLPIIVALLEQSLLIPRPMGIALIYSL